jgi:hypothetical protein
MEVRAIAVRRVLNKMGLVGALPPKQALGNSSVPDSRSIKT